MTAPSILFLLEGTSVPASRFRALQFLPHFKAAGFDVTTRFAYGPNYNAIARTAWAPAYKLATRLRRVAATSRAPRHDIVFAQRPTLPFSGIPEQLLAALNPHLIFDFDDNLLVNGAGDVVPTRARAFHDIIAASAHVIAGNPFLAAQASAPEKTRVIPTVLDTDLYTPGGSRFDRPGEVVIGWMGTSGNFPSVRMILDDLLGALEANPRAIFRLVSNATLPELEGHDRVEQIQWTAEHELDHLRAFDIGLMPLLDTTLTRGKCGFKMIQYMATGTAVLSSAVGANVEIFGESGAGELIDPGSSWRDALDRMIRTPIHQLEQMGEAGREWVDVRYSVRGVLPNYLELFRTMLDASN